MYHTYTNQHIHHLFCWLLYCIHFPVVPSLSIIISSIIISYILFYFIHFSVRLPLVSSNFSLFFSFRVYLFASHFSLCDNFIAFQHCEYG